MAESHTRTSLLTRERAFEDAWITYQSTANRLSAFRIAQLALVAAVRLADGSYDVNAGLGKHIAERTIRWRLSERREQVVEDMINRPLVDMIAEEMQALDEEIAWWAVMSRPTLQQQTESGEWLTTPNFIDDRMKARANLLRVMESKRKLLGIDRPQQIEVTSVTTHDDPATVKMKAALVEAQKRKDAALADIEADTDDDQ